MKNIYNCTIDNINLNPYLRKLKFTLNYKLISSTQLKNEFKRLEIIYFESNIINCFLQPKDIWVKLKI